MPERHITPDGIAVWYDKNKSEYRDSDVTYPYTTPRHATPRHATPRHTTPQYATAHHDMPQRTARRHNAQYNTTLHLRFEGVAVRHHGVQCLVSDGGRLVQVLDLVVRI